MATPLEDLYAEMCKIHANMVKDYEAALRLRDNTILALRGELASVKGDLEEYIANDPDYVSPEDT